MTDYLLVSSDWISYALIDDITDVYAPLIQRIENEVDDIDEIILGLHESPKEEKTMIVRSKLKPRTMLYYLNPFRLCFGSSSDEFEYRRVSTYDDEDEDEKQEYSAGDDSRNMLRRTGEVRKRVMGLYRLLGNKADVIKGFAKRCNEQWEVAPRSEIGLYLGDIQDHIVTMTSNLSHYEK